MRKELKCIRSVAGSEFIMWVTNPRMVIIGVFLIFMRTLAVEPLLERAVKMGVPLDRLEPFAALGNSGVLVMLMPCVFLVLIGDYPKLAGNTLFFVQRAGRRSWFLGQLAFLALADAGFLGMTLVGSVLMSKGAFTGHWSDAVTKYDAHFPQEAGNFTSSLLPSNLYNQMSLVTAVVRIMALMGAYLFLLALMIYFFKLLHMQAFGFLAAMLLVAAGVVTCSLKTKLMWLFPMANTIVWLHFEEILREPKLPVWHSYLYFAGAISVFLILCGIAAKRLQFINAEAG